MWALQWWKHKWTLLAVALWAVCYVTRRHLAKPSSVILFRFFSSELNSVASRFTRAHIPSALWYYLRKLEPTHICTSLGYSISELLLTNADLSIANYLDTVQSNEKLLRGYKNLASIWSTVSYSGKVWNIGTYISKMTICNWMHWASAWHK